MAKASVIMGVMSFAIYVAGEHVDVLESFYGGPWFHGHNHTSAG